MALKSKPLKQSKNAGSCPPVPFQDSISRNQNHFDTFLIEDYNRLIFIKHHKLLIEPPFFGYVPGALLKYRNIHVVASPILVLVKSKKFHFGDIRSDKY